MSQRERYERIKYPEGSQPEDTSSIEISFPVPVHITREQQGRLIDLVDEICKGYEARHPDRVMWSFGIGAKLLMHPMMLSDDEPIPLDESVFSIECAERENYNYPQDRQEALRRMTELDEEIEVDNPGYMTGTPPQDGN